MEEGATKKVAFGQGVRLPSGLGIGCFGRLFGRVTIYGCETPVQIRVVVGASLLPLTSGVLTKRVAGCCTPDMPPAFHTCDGWISGHAA